MYDKKTDTTEIMDLIEITVGVVAHDKKALIKIGVILSNKVYTAIQKLPYYQLKRYVDGVEKLEGKLGKKCKLREKLFSDPNKKNENAMRLLKSIMKSDTEKKIDYLVAATRSMLLELIDLELMFRIFHAIVDSMPEDLIYLSNIVEKKEAIKGNINVQALERTGLMILEGVDANEDSENQYYKITTLGYAVDEFALSLDDEKRRKWHEKRHKK